MHLDIQRNQDPLSISADKYGIIIVVADTTDSDHKKLVGSMTRLAQENMKCKPPLDIFFQWKRKSFFIFDSDLKINDIDKKILNQIKNYMGKLKYSLIVGKQCHKQSTANTIQVMEHSESEGFSVFANPLQFLLDWKIK